jgi:hypothetical protein
MRDFAPFLSAIGALLALVCLIAAFRAGRKRRLIDNLPTSKTSGIFIGFVEVKGTAESAQPLTSFLAETACVHYAWTVAEHWSRTVTESYTDSKGQRRTRTRHESGWKQVAGGGETIPFYLQDDCGVVLVQPDGAKMEPATMFEQTCGRDNPLYYAKGPASAVMNSDHRRRFVEVGIPLKTSLYVVGQARERRDIVAPEIAADAGAPLFLISTRTEEQVSRGMKWGARLWAILGFIAAVGFVVWQDAMLNLDPARRIGIYGAIGGGYLLLGLLVWVWMVFNSLVDLRQRVRAAWSLVDIQLKRRFDLIPNLVNCVKGYRDHETALQAELAALRRQIAATPPGVAGPDHGAVGRQIVAIAERYPELKADTSFLALQKSLADTEQRIALARSYFNDIATHYNTRRETVPEKFVAQLGAMQPQPLMAANDFERAAVKVDLM